MTIWMNNRKRQNERRRKMNVEKLKVRMNNGHVRWKKERENRMNEIKI